MQYFSSPGHLTVPQITFTKTFKSNSGQTFIPVPGWGWFHVFAVFLRPLTGGVVYAPLIRQCSTTVCEQKMTERL